MALDDGVSQKAFELKFLARSTYGPQANLPNLCPIADA
jgi:hypothetical protein